MKDFRETQNARKPLFIALPITIWLAFMIWAVIELYSYFYLGSPLGDEEMSLGIFIGLMAFMNITMAFLLIVILRIQLTVSINGSGIYFEMPPFKKGQLLTPSIIESAELRKISPMKKYAGPGYNSFKRTREYNIFSSWGIYIVLKDKKRYMLGVKNHEAAANALETIGLNKTITH